MSVKVTARCDCGEEITIEGYPAKWTTEQVTAWYRSHQCECRCVWDCTHEWCGCRAHRRGETQDTLPQVWP